MSTISNKISPDKVYVDDVFKLSDFEENCEFYVPVGECYEFFLYSEMMGKKLNLVFYEPHAVCPRCGGEVKDNGRRDRDINKNLPVKIQKYACKNEECNHYFETNLEKFVPKYCNYTHKIREQPIKQLGIDNSSFEKISEQIEVNYGCKPSRTTIYKL